MLKSENWPLHAQLYKMNPHAFFLPSFLRAIRGNTIQSFSDIIHEPAPKVYTFPMFRPAFCEMLMNEVENFQNWAHREKQEINDPNNFHKPSRGTTISDIGMKGMLDDLMKKFISPISKVLFPEVGGRSLDSQHSYVVSYGGDDGGGRPGCSYDGYDNGLDIHVEDSHITLNVCLGKQFTHGQMLFVGSRCGTHVNSEAQPQIIICGLRTFPEWQALKE
ncbi:2-oxoglutarate and iron-dependent oxygenase domain-containing protein CP2-like [Lolium perenne]|uniref:2-oxoglutarate and iron-dependent oxygenase domain-containing protein CP2-like n=1 Tax=Lolium perenne TaxID=4522 RepID=UPI003A99E11B